jgi:hypothetical protein
MTTQAPSPAAARPAQTFPLTPGETYRILPTDARRPGVLYLSGIARLLEVTASGTARFESLRTGGCFAVPLAENRIFRY